MKNVKFSRNGVEFEPTKQELKIVLDDYAKQLGEKDKRIADLEAKLAEKDKLISVYDVEQGMLQCKIANLVVKEIKAEDFAIEQLEKVKEIIDKNYFYNMSSDCCTFDKLEVDFQINNQIKELRGK